MTSLTMIDLFAGAGGLSRGLQDSGFDSLYANEIMNTYAHTFARNHPSTLVDQRDIRGVNAAQVRASLGLEKGQLDLVAGGPPCQGFSINAPDRRTDDSRNHLFREYLRFVGEFRPRAVLIENVPGLVSFEGGTTLEAILASLEGLGYRPDVQILFVPHFGVPQTRWRTIVIALRDGMDAVHAFPTATHSAPFRVNFTSSFAGRRLVTLPEAAGLAQYVSVKDAIGDLPRLRNGEVGAPVKSYRIPAATTYQLSMRAASVGVTNHEAAKLGAINLERMRHIPPGGNWTNIPHELLPKGMKAARRSDHTKRYGRVAPDGLASTILTKCDPHWGAYFHYDQDRAFTVREAARIQSFPDNYEFTGSRVAQYEQVGNAVPPLLAAALGTSIAAALSGSNQLESVSA